MKDSGIDFDKINIDEIATLANDDDDEIGERYNDEELLRQQEEQTLLLSRLDSAKKGHMASKASSTFALVQEKIREQHAPQDVEMDDGSADEAELDGLYDWRAKGVTKN